MPTMGGVGGKASNDIDEYHPEKLAKRLKRMKKTC
jgi:hypothetical protein